MKKIKRLLCRLFPRYKLRCILKTLEWKPIPWQIKFALNKSAFLPRGRGTGKTAAVMLRMLMANPKKIADLEKIVNVDPDYTDQLRAREMWYFHEYDTHSKRCVQAGIPVPELSHRTRQWCWKVKEGKK